MEVVGTHSKKFPRATPNAILPQRGGSERYTGDSTSLPRYVYMITAKRT